MQKKSFGSRAGKALLWGSGLASLPGIAKSIGTPAKTLATDTTDGIRKKTPSLREAKHAWQQATAESPEDLFRAFAQKYDLTEAKRLAMERQYATLFWGSMVVLAGGIVLIYWNLSGILLASLAGMAALGSLYRRDALHEQRLPTFRNWLTRRLWWIFG
jgi:hypothetical protein